ncbi:discoidin domain-containing protein [candidate division KSB1 bacterium]|nr:discoidin domain-containing protein [candidate division KSB1 bacterium]
MKKNVISFNAVVFILLFPVFVFSQPQILDNFEKIQGWKLIASDAVDIDTSSATGLNGNAIKIDFNFTKGTGYCGIQKQFPMDLPENFKFTFYIKGNAPVNNLEFKLVDESGQNVWWLNQRNYEFSDKWTKITIKKRHIQFAWGPTKDQSLRHIDKIEFFVASSTRGNGTIWFDDFTFEALPEPDPNPPAPRIYIVNQGAQMDVTSKLRDKNPATYWESSTDEASPLLIDLQSHREFSAIIIDWDNKFFARAFDVNLSTDAVHWEKTYTVSTGKGGKQFLYLPDHESRFIKLNFTAEKNAHFRMNEIEIKDVGFATSVNMLYSEIARLFPRGDFPRYFYNEASYWTVCGVNGDRNEALINTDGMVETNKGQFSIEPFVFIDSALVTWEDVQLTQSLREDVLPIPSVKWNHADFILNTEIFSDGSADSSMLFLNYTFINNRPDSINAQLFLALRPFQVNPPYQFLNNPGGATKINSIAVKQDLVVINGDKQLFTLTPSQGFGATTFDEGDIVEFLSKGKVPLRTDVFDEQGRCSAALRYSIRVAAGEQVSVYLTVPFHLDSVKEFLPNRLQNPARYFEKHRQNVQNFWRQKISSVRFQLPPSADKLLNTLHSNLAYILINRDGYGIQPGSRSYERSWIRDGALTSSALLKMGMQKEVREFLDWYSLYQFPNGKIPCVVDHRGPDPVPENDSNGEYIFALLQFYNFTGDLVWLNEKFPQVKKAVAYLDSLIYLRSTDYYKNGNDSLRAFYGLLPESISHEGYSDHPRHSYWDDFWAMKGLKDAVTIAEITGENESAMKFKSIRDHFKTNLYNSLQLTVKNHQIDYIPGCVELGDFDATSTTIALLPCNERDNLPQNLLQNTFQRYFDFATERMTPSSTWVNYTPYELRTVGTFIYLNQPDRAHQLLDFFFSHQRPANWNHWAEVVWNEPETAKFIGDMPHTWVGSDYINAVRSFFAYEDELADALIIGAGFYHDWLDSETGIAFENLPTYYGNVSFKLNKIDENTFRIKIFGEMRMPGGGILIPNLWGVEPKSVVINNLKRDVQNGFISIHEIPAIVTIKLP